MKMRTAIIQRVRESERNGEEERECWDAVETTESNEYENSCS